MQPITRCSWFAQFLARSRAISSWAPMSRASVHRPGFSSNPDGLALRLGRKARVFQAVCSSPENAGRELPLHVVGPLSSLNRERIAEGHEIKVLPGFDVGRRRPRLIEADLSRRRYLAAA